MSLFPLLAGSAALSFFVQSFVSLFVVVDPIGNVPLFITLLHRYTEAERRVMVMRAVLVGCTALLVVSLAGNALFALLGISLSAFRIAGGILLIFVSIEMLYGRKTRTESSSDEEHAHTVQEDISVLPLAIPLLTGPGAFTTGIVLFNSAGSVADRVIFLLNVGIIYVISYLILSRSGKVFEYLGKTGTSVTIRIMGLLLLSLAVQFIIEGVGEAFPGLK